MSFKESLRNLFKGASDEESRRPHPTEYRREDEMSSEEQAGVDPTAEILNLERALKEVQTDEDRSELSRKLDILKDQKE